MHPALWLLLRLRLQGWVRRLGRGLRSPRGIVFAIVGIAVLILWLAPSLLMAETPGPDELTRIRHVGPLALLGFCLMNVLFSSAEGGVAFTPAEASLLFPAPFSRRQLLAYKIIGNIGAALFSAAFISIFIRRYAVLMLAAFVAVALVLIFMQLLGILLALLANSLGAFAYNRQRRIVVAIVVIVLAIALFQTGADWLQRDWQQVLEDLLSNRIVQVLLAPMQWFINTLTAEHVWPDLAFWAALSALVDVVLVGVIFSLDAHYLEASAAVSEKLYARLQRARQGGAAALSVPTGKARFAMPMPPRCAGIGPLVWRQLTTALRSLKSLILVAVFFVIFAAPMLLQLPENTAAAVPALLIGILGCATLIVPPLLPFDFRGDLDRLSFLKTLPLPAWRIALGQLLAPVLILTLGQAIVVAVVQVVAGLDAAVWGMMALLLPINCLILAVENFFFLLFPTRQIAGHPGDFQLLGRNILVWMAKLTAIGVALAPASFAGVVAYFLAGQNIFAAFVAAALVITAIVATILPLVAWSFRRFDVARDTPPE